MSVKYKAIISYTEIVHREGISLQRGMNYRVKPTYSIVQMSVRKGAPYNDRWHEDTGILEYEGHDEPRRGGVEPKRRDQPMHTPGGLLTENGKFFRAAIAYKKGDASAEIVQVYEKGPSDFFVGSSRNKGVYRIMANGRLGYDAAAAAEDRATLGSDPSAAAEPYGTGEISRFSGDFACFAHAVGLKALNPNRWPARGIGLERLPRPPGRRHFPPTRNPEGPLFHVRDRNEHRTG
jgi:hypothetical protein